MKDHYKVLGVDKNANDAELKSAFRSQAKKLHPDQNKGNEEWAKPKFREVVDGYKALKDPAQRAKLDEYLATQLSPAQKLIQEATANFNNISGRGAPYTVTDFVPDTSQGVSKGFVNFMNMYNTLGDREHRKTA